MLESRGLSDGMFHVTPVSFFRLYSVDLAVFEWYGRSTIVIAHEFILSLFDTAMWGARFRSRIFLRVHIGICIGVFGVKEEILELLVLV